MKVRYLVMAAVLLAPLGAGAYDVEVIQDNGDPSIRFDIIVMGEGYRDVDQAKMTSDAAWFLGGFWTATPFGEYRNFFNVKLFIF